MPSQTDTASPSLPLLPDKSQNVKIEVADDLPSQTVKLYSGSYLYYLYNYDNQFFIFSFINFIFCMLKSIRYLPSYTDTATAYVCLNSVYL